MPTISSRLRLPLLCVAALLVASTLLRTILAVAFPGPTVVPWTDYLRAFAVGLRFDLTAILVLTIPIALWCLLVSEKRWKSRAWRAVLLGALFIASAGFTFLFVAEGFFFEEFRSRYNTVAIDYLIYPHEVFVNIRESYPIGWIIAGCATVGVVMTWVLARGFREKNPLTPQPRRPLYAFVWLAVTLGLVLSVNIESARFSRERTVNELANNTFVSVTTAALTRNLDYSAFYPTLPPDEAYARTRKLLTSSNAPFTGDPRSLQRRVAGDASRPKLNVILLFEESLGSEFWGVLGRTNTLTPRMDEICRNEALLFDNIYADGNRTIRGYEGVFSSFPPLPGDSIVARDRSDNVETIARVLQRDGYDTTFLYAGRGVFDGTGSFAKRNGWTNFIELTDFKNPAFLTIWGVCNEDLYDRAIEEMRDRHKRGLPFFVTTMSVSNHKPFTYPKGRIAEDPNERRRENVVKYSDYALGRFFDMVRKEPFWTNTIFVVAADHGARVYGSQTIPIQSYEVPVLVVGPAVVPEPRRVSTLGCQLDVAPTILGLIGRPYETVFFGHDLLRDHDVPSRVLLNHNRSIGIYADERLVTFSLNKTVEYFRGNPKTTQMLRDDSPDERSKELEKDATALFQVADDLYMNRRFRIDSTPVDPAAKPPL